MRRVLWAAVDQLAAFDLFHLAVMLAIVLGVFVRAEYVFSADFPLNDGGLFYQMARDIQQAHFALPVVATYNQANIPFAYPPLGFYLGAVLDRVTPISLIEWFRFIPLVTTSLTLGAFFVLARDVVRTRLVVAIAVFAFALVPRSFIWLLMGGGVARSLGLLLAILALHQVHRMYTTGRWWYAGTSMVCAALTVLSHLQTGSFLAFSALLFFVVYGLHRRGVLTSIVVAVGVLALAAPWWALVLSRHGVAPFLAANATGGSIFSDAELRSYLIDSALSLGTTSEPLFPLISTLAFLGMLASVTTRRFLFPAWWLAIILLDARAFPTFSTVPVALLAGIGLTDVLMPVVMRPLRGGAWGTEDASADEEHLFEGVPTARLLRSWAPVLLGAFLWYGTTGALMRAGETMILTALTPDTRVAMEWARAQTKPESRFLVVSGEAWAVDKTSEWLPVLADRVSVATVQGYEWVSGGVFATRVQQHEAVQGCAYAESACIHEWSKTDAIAFDYLFIPKLPDGSCCAYLSRSLRADPRFRPVYEGPGALIMELRREPTPSR